MSLSTQTASFNVTLLTISNLQQQANSIANQVSFANNSAEVQQLLDPVYSRALSAAQVQLPTSLAAALAFNHTFSEASALPLVQDTSTNASVVQEEISILVAASLQPTALMVEANKLLQEAQQLVTVRDDLFNLYSLSNVDSLLTTHNLAQQTRDNAQIDGTILCEILASDVVGAYSAYSLLSQTTVNVSETLSTYDANSIVDGSLVVYSTAAAARVNFQACQSGLNNLLPAAQVQAQLNALNAAYLSNLDLIASLEVAISTREATLASKWEQALNRTHC